MGSPRPNLGFGLGLRTPHYASILAEDHPIDFFEAISENYMVDGGKPLHHLDAVAERAPIVLHGVSMSIGGPADPDLAYLRRLRSLVRRVDAPWVSDHLCWVGTSQASSFDLLPLPMTHEALDLVVRRATVVQDVVEVPLLLENISTYVRFDGAQMSEAEFLNALTRRSGAKLLLDVNNVYVNARNHGIDAVAFMDAIDPASVWQIHLAGHTDRGDHVIDTHDDAIAQEVFALYRHAVRRFGVVSTLIERDDHIPPLAELVAELDRARLEAEEASRAPLSA